MKEDLMAIKSGDTIGSLGGDGGWKTLISYAKCDDCGGDTLYVGEPAGWKVLRCWEYGEKWVCPECKKDYSA